tara:strand:+ start:162 stop:395 length:234 start_codon:yes stop_codon:yes gene_type:complete
MIKTILAILMSGIMFGSFTSMQTTYGDTTKVAVFHENGKVKIEGVKIRKYKHGEWRHYNEKGRLVKIDRYNYGRKLK